MTGPDRDRVRALRALNLLDTPPEPRFDRLARLAARLLDTPIALVSLVDADRQWFKSCIGIDLRETPRTLSFCAHALGGVEALVVEDATADPRFAGNALVTGPPHIRFYAGHPVHAAGGEPLGTLCVIDTRPRSLTAEQLEILRDLAGLVELEINAGDLSRALAARRESARARDAFLRAAAHELRTPITSLRGYAEELLEPGEDGPLDDERLHAAEAVLRNAMRLETLVDDMLLVLRLESGAMAADSDAVPLGEVVRAAAADVVARARERGVAVRLDLADVSVQGDARLLGRAVAGLVGSAVDSSPAGGEIRVEVTGDAAAATVCVADASGRAPDVAADPFGPAGGRPRLDPTGLAAAIARGVGELHGGGLELAPAADGGGTAAVLRLARPPQASGGVNR